MSGRRPLRRVEELRGRGPLPSPGSRATKMPLTRAATGPARASLAVSRSPGRRPSADAADCDTATWNGHGGASAGTTVSACRAQPWPAAALRPCSAPGGAGRPVDVDQREVATRSGVEQLQGERAMLVTPGCRTAETSAGSR